MLNLMRGVLLAGLVSCVGTSSVWGDSYTLSLPELEGVRFSYGDSIHTPIDFGQSFAQIDQITISITGTGHTGSAYVSVGLDPWNPRLEVIDLDAEFMVFLSDDGDADSVFFHDFGEYAETTTTHERTETEVDPLLNGIGILRLKTNVVLSIGGGWGLTDRAFLCGYRIGKCHGDGHNIRQLWRSDRRRVCWAGRSGPGAETLEPGRDAGRYLEGGVDR